jgi:hypothetical protein
MRRLSAFVVVIAIAGAAVAAEAPKAPRQQQVATLIEASPSTPLTIAALFAVAGDAAITRTGKGESIQGGEIDVMVARVETDGTRNVSCLNTETAVRRFLERQSKAETPAPKE